MFSATRQHAVWIMRPCPGPSGGSGGGGSCDRRYRSVSPDQEYRRLQGLSPDLAGTDSQNSWQSFSCLTNSCLTNTESANEAPDKHER